MPRRLLSCALVLVLVSASGLLSTLAQDSKDGDARSRTAIKFLEGLRAHGYHDLALDYIEQLRKDPDTPADLKEVLEFEEGRSLLAESSGSSDLESKHQQLEKARTKLDAFAKAHPNHRLAPEALVEMARLLFERGQTAVLLANEQKSPGDKQAKINEARASFEASRAAYERAQVPLKKTYESYRKFLEESDPRRAERDRAHIALMSCELQRSLAEYELAQTFPYGSKERNDLLGTALTEFENVYKRYRTQLAGLYARMMQAKCYEEQGKLTEAMGVYKELMDHTDPAFRSYQRKIAYFQMIVHGKRGEHPRAVDLANEWLKAFPNALRTDEGIGVRLELAKNILAQLPELSDADKEVAIRRATDLLSEISRYYSTFKPEAIKLLQKYKPKAAINAQAITGLPYDDAYAQGEAAASTHEWDRAIALFKQALRKADPNKDVDKANRARHMMAYCYYESQRYYEADVLAEHIARNYPRFAMAPQAAEIGLASLTFAYNTFNQVDRESDIPRLQSLCKYTAETWPETAQADAARFTLGQIALGRGDYGGAAEAYESVRTGSPKRLDAMIQAGEAHWREGLVLREKGKDAEADAAAKKALEVLDAALKSRRDANVPLTDLGMINNMKALAEIHRNSGRPQEALALIEPLTKAIAATKPLTPELREQLGALLSMQLRSHIANGQADLAIGDMKALEANADKNVSLTQLYVELGRTLQKELEAQQTKKYTTNLNKTKQAYTQFVLALAASKAGQTFSSLAFAGEALLGLDKPKEAQEILDRLAKDTELQKGLGGSAGPLLARVDLKRAEALRKQGKFNEARSLLSDLYKKNGNDLNVLFEQGILFEDWARVDPKQWEKARGHWSWLAKRLENNRSRKLEYYDSLYHCAVALQGMNQKAEAAGMLKSVMALSPSVGSPEMKSKYQKFIDQMKQ